VKPAITHLAQLSDDRLFEQVSEGIRLILENAESLEETARRLVQMNEFRVADLVRRLAEEEASKGLILIDAVRCPRDQVRNPLNSFNDHVAKGIYAQACSWRPTNFGDVSHYAETERRQFYLDGPSDVDWIYSNSITTERNRAMYVDYVQDVTEEAGHYSWISPLSHYSAWYTKTYSSPEALIVARAIQRIGATSPEGLGIVARLWRSFIPNDKTPIMELYGLIRYTFESLKEERLVREGSAGERRDALLHWPFPLWSLQLNAEPRAQEKKQLSELRRMREDHIEWRTEMEAIRDPPPVISRAKVEDLSKAFARWDREMDMLIDAHEENRNKSGGFRIVPTSLSDQFHGLESYKCLECMLRELTDGERMDLVAIGWFGRRETLSWPNCHRQAHTSRDLDYRYQAGLGREWLRGLDRWESNPEEWNPWAYSAR
jgi:AbiV family abortive infection protein